MSDEDDFDLSPEGKRLIREAEKMWKDWQNNEDDHAPEPWGFEEFKGRYLSAARKWYAERRLDESMEDLCAEIRRVAYEDKLREAEMKELENERKEAERVAEKEKRDLERQAEHAERKARQERMDQQREEDRAERERRDQEKRNEQDRKEWEKQDAAEAEEAKWVPKEFKI